MKKLIYIFLVVAIISCKKDKNETPTNSSNNQPFQLSSYPLTIGNKWQYHVESFQYDSNGVKMVNQYGDKYWSVVSDTVINGVSVAKVSQVDSVNGVYSNAGYSYYAGKTDGLYKLAEEHVQNMLFRNLQSPQVNQFGLEGDNDFLEFKTQSFYVPDTPYILLHYPSLTGDTWQSHQFQNALPDIIKRKYLGNATVTTPAGTFDCVKLEVFWDYDHNNEPDSASPPTYQYFSSKGLVQEESNHKDPVPNGAIIYRLNQLVHVNF